MARKVFFVPVKFYMAVTLQFNYYRQQICNVLSDTKIGYPEYIRSAELVDEYYKDLNISDNLYDAILQFRRWRRKLDSDKLNKPPDSKE